ncbi:hypothetical protein [Tychonema sp. LEGE 06208]|uniref:hypothetical protein n=1 Tax=Tychonema sp. LEGE 06208 TaxID=1828663 RepID=UPI001D151500|nr:hypothetical protein [Tychonema sp. LEGE 06208]
MPCPYRGYISGVCFINRESAVGLYLSLLARRLQLQTNFNLSGNQPKRPLT